MFNTLKTKTFGRYFLYIIVLLIIFLAGVFFYNNFQKNTKLGIADTGQLSANIQETVKIPTIKKVTLLAVGDIMMHQAQLDATYNKKTNSYDFSSFFKNINSYLKGGDIVYANLETPVAGSALKYSGYPKFNAPTEILAELKNNYFTHVSLANNHALDRGAVGLANTIKNVEDAGLVGFGARVGSSTSPSNGSSTGSSAESIANYQITEKNGLKLGFLSYTYDTNGLTLPKSKAGMLSYINKEQIVKDIRDLKIQNVDATIVALHFGIEYKLQENASQRELAKLACDSGADIILGDHPHVLEPITFLQDSNGRKCLVIYSLGNFISGMTNPYTDLGGILKVEITKTESGGVESGGVASKELASSTISMKPDFLATWVKRGTNMDGSKYYTVLPLEADKIPAEINVTSAEQKRLEMYRDFVETKIKANVRGVDL